MLSTLRKIIIRLPLAKGVAEFINNNLSAPMISIQCHYLNHYSRGDGRPHNCNSRHCKLLFIFFNLIIYHNSLMKAFIILCLLVVLSSCTYNKTIARKMTYAAAAAYATDAEISSWSCKTCLLFKLVKVLSS